MRRSRHQGEKRIETTGVWLFGGLTVLLALGKVMGLWGWSWGYVAVPMLILLVALHKKSIVDSNYGRK